MAIWTAPRRDRSRRHPAVAWLMASPHPAVRRRASTTRPWPGRTYILHYLIRAAAETLQTAGIADAQATW